MRYDHLKTFTGAQARHWQNCEVALITGNVHVFKTAERFLCLKMELCSREEQLEMSKNSRFSAVRESCSKCRLETPVDEMFRCANKANIFSGTKRYASSSDLIDYFGLDFASLS